MSAKRKASTSTELSNYKKNLCKIPRLPIENEIETTSEMNQIRSSVIFKSNINNNDQSAFILGKSDFLNNISDDIVSN